MDLLNEAYNALQQGDSHSAQTLLLSLIKEEPDNSQACYLLGLTKLQLEDEATAIDWFTKTITLSPEATPAHYNLGVLYTNRGDLHLAKKAYQTALDQAPDDIDIRFNFALTCKKLGLLDEAKTQYKTILQAVPNDTDTLYNLAKTEQQLHNNNDAISLLESLLQHEPDHLSALNNLGYLYHKEGNPEKAIPVYKKVIANSHNVTAAKHLLASLTGTTTTHAPTDYVKDVFDQFADHFDESLQQKLSYNTPTILREILDSEQPGTLFNHGLDLGCGTGLSGETFRNCSTALTGIDLSPKMLDQAQAKNIYIELHESDLVPFIQKSTIDYDLYLAADVFVYIGDLDPIFTAIAKKEGPKTLIFSTEHASEEYILKPTGRYGHSIDYIQKLAKKYGFTIVVHKSAPIRKEGDKWINGELYILSI